MTDENIGSKAAASTEEIYDPTAHNRFEFEIRANGGIYDVAFVFGEVSDERYLRWLKDFNVSGTEDSVDENSREATVDLWNDIVVRAENVEYDDDADWKALIDPQDKIDSINPLLAVAIVEPEEKRREKLRLGAVENITVITEAWQNGTTVQQTHKLRPKTLELEKKFSRIRARRLQQAKIGGSLKRKAPIRYIPQDEAIAALYDEMLVSVSGFANETVPLRFKTAVVDSLFASRLDPKK